MRWATEGQELEGAQRKFCMNVLDFDQRDSTSNPCLITELSVGDVCSVFSSAQYHLPPPPRGSSYGDKYKTRCSCKLTWNSYGKSGLQFFGFGRYIMWKNHFSNLLHKFEYGDSGFLILGLLAR